MTAAQNDLDSTVPSAPTSMRTTIAQRSTLGFSEHLSAEHGLDARDEDAARLGRVADDLRHHALTGAGRALALLESDVAERRRDARIVGLEVHVTPGGAHDTGQLGATAHQHFLNLALGA